MNLRRPLVPFLAACLAGALPAQTFAPLVGRHLSFSTGDSTPPELEELLAGDLDGDGAPDLLALCMGHSFVCRNDRAGGFVAWQTLNPLGYYLRRGALADLDGDGDLDVLAGQGTTRPNATAMGPVHQFENRAGTFVETTYQRMPNGPNLQWLCGAFVTLDHDRDGDVDLAMSVFLDQTTDLVVMDNDGQGNFTLSSATRLPAGLPRRELSFLAATDLDRDGDADLVASSRTASLFLRNDGTGRFADHTASLPTGAFYAVHDFDADGDDDLLASNTVWLNDGNASAFTARSSGVALDSNAVRVADMNGDGLLDLLTTQFQLFWGPANNDLLPHVRLGQANGTFVEQPAFLPAELRAEQTLMSSNTHWVGSSPMLVMDLDRDGRPDVLHGGWKADISGNSWTVGLPPRALINRAGAELRDGSRRTIAMLDMEIYGLVPGDVDGDGDADLIAGQFPDRVFRNRGDGTFELGEALPSGGMRHGLLVDLDRDGDLDLLSTGIGLYLPGPYPWMLLRQGSGWIGRQLPTLPDPGHAFATGDVDGDGDIDIVVGCLSGGFGIGATTRLLLNDGAANFTDATAGRLPSAPQDTPFLFLRDVDDDGDLDLIEASFYYPANRLRLSFNDGTGVFTEVTATRMPGVPETYDLAAVDVERDGDVDLVTRGLTLLNDGSGWFSMQTNTVLPFQHLVDLDGSGTWTSIRAERGQIVIGAQSHSWNSESENVAAPFDADGDGDLDVAVGGWVNGFRPYNFNMVAGVLFNLERQLFAPRLLRVGQPWVLSLQATAASSVALPFVGITALEPRPLLLPFGELGIDPATAFVLPAIAAGTSPVPNEMSLLVPLDGALLGVSVHAQALVVPSSGLAGARFTGVVSDLITL